MTGQRLGVAVGAVLLGVLGFLVVPPLAVVDSLWLGPQVLGAAVGEDRLWVVAGVGTFIFAALPVLGVAVAVALVRGGRGARALGLALALVFVGISLTPIHAFSPLSWVPAGRWIVVGLGIATVVLLLVGRRQAGRDDGGVAHDGRRVGRASRVPLIVGIALLALLPLGFLAAAVSDGLPNAPSGLLVSDFAGGDRLTSAPLPVGPAPGPAGLLPGQGSNIHGDSAMSDAYRGVHAIDPRSAEVRSFRALGDCASVLFDRGGRLVAVCVGGTRIVAHLLDPETLEPLAERQVGERELTTDFATNFAGGGYAVLDRAGRLVIGSSAGTIDRYRIGPPEAPAIEPLDSFDVSSTLQPGEPITSALPDASGELWYVGREGSVGLLDPRAGDAHALHFDDAEIENSFALAPRGGAYVVTSEELVRLEAGEGGRPRIVWGQPYDNGTRRKPGQTSRASGTTPTVMLGGRYVAIADNAEPRMHVQVYDARPRQAMDEDRLVCETPVFPPGKSATENSLIAAGRALFVENNYGYRLFDLLGGHSSEPGAARIDFDSRRGECDLAWTNDEVRIPSVVSKVSAADGTMLTYTKPEYPAGIDAWYVTALDAATGETLWKRRAGAGAMANNHYAALYVGPEGDIYVGTVGGVIGLVDG